MIFGGKEREARCPPNYEGKPVAPGDDCARGTSDLTSNYCNNCWKDWDALDEEAKKDEVKKNEQRERRLRED